MISPLLEVLLTPILLLGIVVLVGLCLALTEYLARQVLALTVFGGLPPVQDADELEEGSSHD